MKVKELLEAKVIDINPELNRRKRQAEIAKQHKDEDERAKNRMKRKNSIKMSDEVAKKRLEDPSTHAAEARRLSKLFKKD